MGHPYNPSVELVLNLLEAADQVDTMSRSELERLLREAAYMLGELIERGVPRETPNPASATDPASTTDRANAP
jgi:hypothetical protein